MNYKKTKIMNSYLILKLIAWLKLKFLNIRQTLKFLFYKTNIMKISSKFRVNII